MCRPIARSIAPERAIRPPVVRLPADGGPLAVSSPTAARSAARPKCSAAEVRGGASARGPAAGRGSRRGRPIRHRATRVGVTEEGSERGPCAANVELPAIPIPRLVGRHSVWMPAIPPNSAHLRPTRGPDAAFMRPNQPDPSSLSSARLAWRRMGGAAGGRDRGRRGRGGAQAMSGWRLAALIAAVAAGVVLPKAAPAALVGGRVGGLAARVLALLPAALLGGLTAGSVPGGGPGPRPRRSLPPAPAPP